jgi:lipoyl synthase
VPHTTHAPLRLPPELRKKRGGFRDRGSVMETVRRGGLHTVCEEARCPNIGECFSQGTATFMILGDTCTRRCHFCAVKTGKPGPPNPGEPDALAEAASSMDLKHVVITSVDRDDLSDFGAAHFGRCIEAVRASLPSATIEILTPDFKGKSAAIDTVLKASPDVFNHNIETVHRLYKKVRPQSDWETTTGLLRYVADAGHLAVKSGLMVGLGETDEEVDETLTMLKELGVHIATIGQYLRPTLSHWEVQRYVSEPTYERWRSLGEQIGFSHTFAGPFVRSSYNAAEAMRDHTLNAKRGNLSPRSPSAPRSESTLSLPKETAKLPIIS